MNDKKHKDHMGMVSSVVFSASFVIFLFCCVMNFLSDESKWLIPLFLLPLGLQFLCSIALYLKPRETGDLKTFYNFYVAMMSVCIVSYCSLWLAYLYCWKTRGDVSHGTFAFLSATAGLCIVILLGFVVLMTIVILTPSARMEGVDSSRWENLLKWVESLKAGVSQVPSHALSLFFSAFLAVSYLFGFAFAFHDKSLPSQTPALFMRNFYLEEAPSEITPIPGEFSFQFEEGRAIPEIEQNKSADQDKGTKKRVIAERREQNHASLEAIVQKILAVTQSNNKVRIVLIGRANEKPVVGVSYLSNYELSAARAQNVEYAIMERLSKEANNWRNIEWVIVPASNESPALPLSEINAQGKEVPKSASSQPGAKVVEVHLESISKDLTALQMQRFEQERKHPSNKQLDLIDYIYFANYTVTTTGYGDIVPLTPYAKFICSFANICEVFFLVVFFNALLSLKRDREIISPLSLLFERSKLGKSTSESENIAGQE